MCFLLTELLSYARTEVDNAMKEERRATHNATDILLLDCCNKIRSSVLQFIDAVKSSALNPYDYLSISTVNNLSKEVVLAMRLLVAAAGLTISSSFLFRLFRFHKDIR